MIDDGEECDDGVDNSDFVKDACRLDCSLAHCGDGVVDSQETCDDGNDLNSDACVQGCVPASCGDGYVHLDLEQCDDDVQNSDADPDACRTDCTLPVCGDGVVDSKEQCDDGAQNSDADPDACRVDCSLPSCGDGVTDTGEECDDGDADNNDGCNSQCEAFTFIVGPFTADYYENERLVSTEQVPRPALDYSYDDFHGIDSENFRAVWTGTLEVVSPETQSIDIYFDFSWAQVTLSVDGMVVDSYDSDKAVTYQFTHGKHEVVIEYINNWHTVGFYTSFDQDPLTDEETAATFLEPVMAQNPVIVYVGGYVPDHRYREVKVEISGAQAPVLLILSTYHAATWNIVNPKDHKIAAIVYSSFSLRSSVISEVRTPTVGLDSASRIDYAYDDFTDAIADIVALTGREPDYLFGEYSIPAVQLDLSESK